MSETLRIAMWSGPRNISTAMMRAFEARGDAAVFDEPFYAAFLAASGADHPMREAVIASQPTDPCAVIAQITGPAPGGKPIWYQKHMAHHMLEGFSRSWMAGFANAFLIRDPESVLASYAARRNAVDLADIGYVQQRELFERECDRLGRPPPVINGADVLADPARVLRLLCETLGIAYSDAMLGWAPGRRTTDGVWAPAWYAAVEQSTGFAAPGERPAPALPDHLRRLAEAARPHFEALAAYRLA